MIVTIDGPAGSGKSSTARTVAERLGFHHLESGGFYRALTHAALEAEIPPEGWHTLSAEELDSFHVHARPADSGYRLFIKDNDITDALRSSQVDAHVSAMARVPVVRDWLLERLRRAADEGSLVADGRDMGTIVFPDADLKVFLTADTKTRARRRLRDRGVHNPTAEVLSQEEARLIERDRTDSEREVAPLRRPVDAVVVDTTNLDFNTQVDRIVRLVRAREEGRPGPNLSS